ncbi:UL20 [anatid alphaherpesvirus 1]|uniref:UL20 n=1 Tax=anatid alphaherpesvirus 1 TaxID=104388 RepID=G3GR21_9ALPH|nr:UL20 [Anatid alphaherpesvirus 1]AEN80105.1 UL20 [Anatid alphaherpesvirus 1]UEC79322.1 UL20 [Anatid alphaherpesvirus 1]UJO49835.1 UL20 [Anatid alphaherpesvirus 1]UJO49910.1 UL20 [Anatid alphaherpesvirus 1]WKE35622.1 UL20 [Anatid alphaherpesvirus 1]
MAFDGRHSHASPISENTEMTSNRNNSEAVDSNEIATCNGGDRCSEIATTVNEATDIIDDLESVTEFMALTSYGFDADIYSTSAFSQVPASGHPVFTRYVVIFWLSTLIIKPLCCGVFAIYYYITGDYRFLAIGLGATAAFYVQLFLTVLFIYINVRKDLLPLKGLQRIVVGTIALACPVVFAATAYTFIFQQPEFFDRILYASFKDDSGSSRLVHFEEAYGPIRVDATIGARGASCITLIAVIIYATGSLGDALGFLLPRLWTRAVMKTCVGF